MTDLQKLEQAIQILGALRPPIAMTESIGLPIFQALVQIDSVAASMRQQEQERKQADAQVQQALQAQAAAEASADEIAIEGVEVSHEEPEGELIGDDNQNGSFSE